MTTNAFPYTVQYTYSPRENVGSRGTSHIVPDEDVTLGRIKRKAGQPICTTRRFWGLSGVTYNQVTCKRCAELAEKLNIQNTHTEEDKTAIIDDWFTTEPVPSSNEDVDLFALFKSALKKA